MCTFPGIFFNLNSLLDLGANISLTLKSQTLCPMAMPPVLDKTKHELDLISQWANKAACYSCLYTFFHTAAWMGAIDWRGFGAPPPDISVWTKALSLWVSGHVRHGHWQCNKLRGTLNKKLTKKKTSSMQFLSQHNPTGRFDISVIG